MKPVSTVSSARTHWWTSLSLLKKNIYSVLNATPMSTLPSVVSARRPSCQVRTWMFRGQGKHFQSLQEPVGSVTRILYHLTFQRRTRGHIQVTHHGLLIKLLSSPKSILLKTLLCYVLVLEKNTVINAAFPETYLRQCMHYSYIAWYSILGTSKIDNTSYSVLVAFKQGKSQR